MRRLLIAFTTVTLLTAACGRSDTDASVSTTTAQTAAPTSTTAASGPAVSTGGTGTLVEPLGASGVGDPYFPELGNGGYDVDHYDIDIAIDPVTAEIEATTTVTATATETLGTFDLDLLGLDISALSVDGAPAEYVREGPELRISPAGGIVAGEEFSVVVSYSGRPQPIDLPSIGIEFGWTQTADEIYVAAEPDAARTWYPSNDHPSDKATFTFHVTVPTPLTAAANGRLVEVIDNGDSQTWVWDLESPMATYLATVVVGDYQRVDSDGPDGIVLRDYIPASFGGSVPLTFGVTAEAIEVFSDWFGPYPFDRYGHIVVHDLGGALETQTLTLIGEGALFDDVVVHELTHMWFGDAVSPATWQDVWLNEGFATFGEFLWREHREGEASMLRRIDTLHSTLSNIEHRPIFDPTETELFGPAVYWRGGMTLHALRVALDDDALLRRILQTYFTRYRYGHASTDDFIAVVHEVSGRDFTELWDAWLYSSELPDLP